MATYPGQRTSGARYPARFMRGRWDGHELVLLELYPDVWLQDRGGDSPPAAFVGDPRSSRAWHYHFAGHVSEDVHIYEHVPH